MSVSGYSSSAADTLLLVQRCFVADRNNNNSASAVDSSSSSSSTAGSTLAGRLSQRSCVCPDERCVNSSATSGTRFNMKLRHKNKEDVRRTGVASTPRTVMRRCRVLKKWLIRHRDMPYPTGLDKRLLAHHSNMTLVQVSNWFANARRRLKRTVVDPDMSWARRIRLYDSRVVGKQEPLDVTDDDDDDDDIDDVSGDVTADRVCKRSSLSDTCTSSPDDDDADSSSSSRSLMVLDDVMSVMRSRDVNVNMAAYSCDDTAASCNVTPACYHESVSLTRIPTLVQTDAPGPPTSSTGIVPTLLTDQPEDLSVQRTSARHVTDTASRRHAHHLYDPPGGLMNVVNHQQHTHTDTCCEDLCWKELSAALALTAMAVASRPRPPTTSPQLSPGVVLPGVARPAGALRGRVTTAALSVHVTS